MGFLSSIKNAVSKVADVATSTGKMIGSAAVSVVKNDAVQGITGATVGFVASGFNPAGAVAGAKALTSLGDKLEGSKSSVGALVDGSLLGAVDSAIAKAENVVSKAKTTVEKVKKTVEPVEPRMSLREKVDLRMAGKLPVPAAPSTVSHGPDKEVFTRSGVSTSPIVSSKSTGGVVLLVVLGVVAFLVWGK